MKQHARRFWPRVCMALAMTLPLFAQAAVTCNVNSTGIAFGTFRPLDNVPQDSTGTITIACTWDGNGSPTLTHSIALTPGNGGSAYAPRRMTSGGNTLDYNLYSAASYSGTVWGDGSGGSERVIGNAWTLSGTAQETRSHTVYGRIPGGQGGVHVGNYADTITITVSY